MSAVVVLIKIFSAHLCSDYFLYILPALVTFRKIFYAEKGVGICFIPKTE